MQDLKRDRRRGNLCRVEALEPRELLTGGFGNQFAEVYGNITSAGGSTTVQFTIDPTLIHRPRGTMLLGIDVASVDGTAQPAITSVRNAQGKALPGLQHATYDPAVQAKLNGKTQTSAVLVTIPAAGKAAKTYSLQVSGLNNSSGAVQVGFYLPGDVNGDGTVTKSDLKTLQADEGSILGATTYGIDADTNRNGKVDKTDLTLARQDLGVSTAIVPTVKADIASSSTFNAATRTATAAGVTVEGTATPGTLVNLSEIKDQIPKVGTVADASGHFQVTGQLAPGSDTLTLTASDKFGQGFEETMLPINYATSSPGKTSSG